MRRATQKRVRRLLLAAAIMPVSVPAQPQSPGTSPASQPRPVEQGVADLNPLQVSPRLEPVDLRHPTGWERVYRLSGDARGGGDGLFARIDGGIAAVFPWSAYQSSRKGLRAEVPAGTTYYIGGVPEALLAKRTSEPDASRQPAFNFVDLSARRPQPERPLSHAGTAAATSAREASRYGERSAEAPAGPSIWSSESYRRSRIEALLTAAADRRADQP